MFVACLVTFSYLSSLAFLHFPPRTSSAYNGNCSRVFLVTTSRFLYQFYSPYLKLSEFQEQQQKMF